jgi:hypothetical protein
MYRGNSIFSLTGCATKLLQGGHSYYFLNRSTNKYIYKYILKIAVCPKTKSQYIAVHPYHRNQCAAKLPLPSNAFQMHGNSYLNRSTEINPKMKYIWQFPLGPFTMIEEIFQKIHLKIHQHEGYLTISTRIIHHGWRKFSKRIPQSAPEWRIFDNFH